MLVLLRRAGRRETIVRCGGHWDARAAEGCRPGGFWGAVEGGGGRWDSGSTWVVGRAGCGPGVYREILCWGVRGIEFGGRGCRSRLLLCAANAVTHCSVESGRARRPKRPTCTLQTGGVARNADQVGSEGRSGEACGPMHGRGQQKVGGASDATRRGSARTLALDRRTAWAGAGAGRRGSGSQSSASYGLALEACPAPRSQQRGQQRLGCVVGRFPQPQRN